MLTQDDYLKVDQIENLIKQKDASIKQEDIIDSEQFAITEIINRNSTEKKLEFFKFKEKADGNGRYFMYQPEKQKIFEVNYFQAYQIESQQINCSYNLFGQNRDFGNEVYKICDVNLIIFQNNKIQKIQLIKWGDRQTNDKIEVITQIETQGGPGIIYSIYNEARICYYYLLLEAHDNAAKQQKRHGLIYCMNIDVPKFQFKSVFFNYKNQSVQINLLSESKKQFLVVQLAVCSLYFIPEYNCNLCLDNTCERKCQINNFNSCGKFSRYGQMVYYSSSVLILILLGLILKNFKKIIFTLAKIVYGSLKFFFYTIPIYFLRFVIRPFLRSVIQPSYRLINRGFQRFVFFFIRIGRKCVFCFKFCRKKVQVQFNQELEQYVCPICLEEIYNREWTIFSCGRHEVHVDCYKQYEQNIKSSWGDGNNNIQDNNQQIIGCPFRD